MYKQPHWVNEHDLEELVSEIDKLEPNVGANVKYLAAPDATGKTSAVLSAFLRGAERGKFTHYIYIAFKNTGSRNFTSLTTLNKNTALAEQQGAAFIVKCVETILTNQENEGGKFLIYVDMDDQSLGTYNQDKEMEQIVSKLSSGDSLATILFHVDEHGNMCERTGDENDPGVSFSKGAMETLALLFQKLLLLILICQIYLILIL